MRGGFNPYKKIKSRRKSIKRSIKSKGKSKKIKRTRKK